MNNHDSWTLLIGEITAPHGLHGEVRVFPHTDFPERFADLKQVGLRRNAGPVDIVKVLASRITGRRIVLRLEGIETIDQAEDMRGVQLLVPESELHVLEEDEYYYHQLIGLEVVTTAGEPLGTITRIFPTGANDVYETPLALIPATKDMIREIDLARGRMVVDARPGLKISDTGE